MAEAKFTTGSTMRHVAVMTTTGGAGLMALFLVDVLNLFYISLLGQRELAAAIGFAGTVQFFMISMAIGLSIAATAVVSRAVGAGDQARARRLAASSLVLLLAVIGAAVALVWIGRGAALDLLGASGETRDIAAGFLAITLPSLPLMGMGMIAGGLLRAVGDGRRAMFITLTGGAAAAVLDPILIFAMGLGIDGAAIALVITRTIFALVGLYLAVHVHNMVGRIDLRAAAADARTILGIGLPSMATQISTPFGNAFLTGVVAAHGDAAVAGWAVIGRLTPLAFGVIFALSGAVGPILGQNRGAGLWGRIRMAYRDALVFSAAWVLSAWAALWLATDLIVRSFQLTAEGAEVLRAFTTLGAGAFLFTGALFVSNAAFNNLGRPTLSTAFNWSRDAAAIPLLALVIGDSAGASGVILVQAAAGLVVGSAAALYAWHFIGRLSRAAPGADAVAIAQPAFASGRTALAAQLVAEESSSALAPRKDSR
ncbi:MAG TPA: MATE family efflux transporter [Thermohalobaculum sp.]|nr:MATE family efflux transporter [Thermohalobaculum sp.]